MIALWVVLGIIVILFFIVIGMYNSLVGFRNQVKNAWAQIDVQLKRRHDLIPNLVETVKGYAKHERETFEMVTNARNMAQQAISAGPAERGKAEGELSAALGRLFAVAEAYPELKASHELSGSPGRTDFYREQDKLFPPVLQRLGVEVQQQDTDVPVQYHRGNVQL